MHIPKHAIQNKMRQDGVEEERMSEVEDFMAGKPAKRSPSSQPVEAPKLDPKLEKYKKMVKMHIPKHAVENKMRQDGIDPSRYEEIEAFLSGKPIAKKPQGKIIEKLDPALKKYMKMMK